MKLVLNNKLDRYVVKSGWLYILVNSAHPNWFKVGRSNHLPARQKQYNRDSPVSTASMVLISLKFYNVHVAEERVLQAIKDLGICPAPGKLEWFDIKHKRTVVHLIDAEEELYQQNNYYAQRK